MDKPGLQVAVNALPGQALRPIEREIKMASPGIQLIHLTGRRLLVFQKRAYCLIKRCGKKFRLFILECTLYMLECRNKGAKFAQ